MGNPVGVEQHLDRRGQTGHPDLAVQMGERLPYPPGCAPAKEGHDDESEKDEFPRTLPHAGGSE
jgi:hypothetical protein